MKTTITCHQYATGRGPSGYGFIAYSKTDENKQDASFTFSLNKWVGLRFSQLPELSEDEDYVLEIDPASTDFRHSGAFLTKNREEGGSSSIYTHVLITKDQPEEAEALGLLKPENFLTPDEFSEVTHQTLSMSVEDKDCDIPAADYAPLDEEQKKRLGEFLARYWVLLEQKEWSGKGTPELALILPQMKMKEMIAFFAREVMPRLPKYVRPAVSVAFGAKWNNRGTIPSVCCVLPDNSESPFPCYNPCPDGTNQARPAIPVEQKIGELLIKGDNSDYPETYKWVEKLAETDNACGNMARGFSLMAFCVQADLFKEQANPIENMKKAYTALCKLAEGRYGIAKEKHAYVFLPLLQDVFNLIQNTSEGRIENLGWMLQEYISLHRSEANRQILQSTDEMLIKVFSSLGIEQMSGILSSKWQDLKAENLSSDRIYDLLGEMEKTLLKKYQGTREIGPVQSAISQYVRLNRDAGDKAKNLIDQYRAWLCDPSRVGALLAVLSANDAPVIDNEDLYFALLEQAKDTLIRQGNVKDTILVDDLKVVRKAGERNKQRADKILKETYPYILKWTHGKGAISSAEGFGIISELIRSQPHTKDTIDYAMDLAADNADNKDAAAYLEDVMKKIILSEAADDPEYQEILFKRLQDEPAIVNFLKAAGKAKEENAKRTNTIVANAYPIILDWIGQGRRVEDSDFPYISELILSQPQTCETISPSLGFATENVDCQGADVYHKQVLDKILLSPDAETPEYQGILFEGLQDETSMVGFLQSVSRVKMNNPKRSAMLEGNAFPVIRNWLDQNGKVSKDSFSTIANLFLSQPQTKETIDQAIDFATSDPDNEQAAGYLKQVTEKMVNIDKADDEYRGILFDKLEEAWGIDPKFRMDENIRKLLEKTNNQVLSKSGKYLQACEKIKNTRLYERLEGFFSEAGAESGKALEEKWDDQNARKYSCRWQELSAEDLSNPIRSWFDKNYEASDDKILFLETSWKDAVSKESSVYGDTLRKVVKEKLADEYDIVWKKETSQEKRDMLDLLLDGCKSGEYDGTLDKCKGTTAGKARTFLKDLKALCDIGMAKKPEAAGKLILKMRDEKGFENCIRIDPEIKREDDGNLCNLVTMLLQEIQSQPDGTDYWQVPLSKLGVDRNAQVWSEDGYRMMNVLAFITQKLDDMKIPELGTDLKQCLGEEFMQKLKSDKAAEKCFHGDGKGVLCVPLYQWLNKVE